MSAYDYGIHKRLRADVTAASARAEMAFLLYEKAIATWLHDDCAPDLREERRKEYAMHLEELEDAWRANGAYMKTVVFPLPKKREPRQP